MSTKGKTYLITGIISGVVYLLFCLMVIHIKLVLAENPDMDILTGISEGMTDMAKQPFAIFPIPQGSFLIIIGITAVIAFIVFSVTSNAKLKQHYDSATAQGKARWMSGKELINYCIHMVEPLGQKRTDGKYNMILARKLMMSMDSRGISDHNNFEKMRNNNVFAIGGSGAGKSFGLVGPNILQANCSMIITDPSGGLFKDYGWFLEYEGYRIKCLNLANMEKGNHYNPFNYIKDDKDIEVLVNTLISNTTPPESHSGDPFWEKSETALLLALIAYLFHYAPAKFKNFSNVMALLRLADMNESDETAQTQLDIMFAEAEEKDPEGFAAKQYATFKLAGVKTMKSILISCAVRLQQFDLRVVADLTDTDDIDLDSIGDEKTALFVIIPTGDTTFNFIAAMMYSQLFQRLYDYAENTARYSQLVLDSEGEVIRTFRANSPEGSKRAREKGEKFLNKAKTAYIKEDKNTGLFYIYSQDNKILRYSNKKEKAEEFLASMRNGKVVKNTEGRPGDRLPIHTRFLLDEFANTGRIPNFQEKVATIRKYEISVTIILQSLQQMQNLYEKEWESISGNCDNTIYLGGGSDTVTAKWMSELMGKETRKIQSLNFNSGNQGGSEGIQIAGVELMAPADLRVMDERDCIVLQKSLYPYKGRKYPAAKHPNWKYVAKTPGYKFNGRRQSFLYKEYLKAGITDESEEEITLTVTPETKEEENNRKAINEDFKKKTEEIKNNKDILREPIVGQPSELLADDDDFAEEVLKVSSEEEVEEIVESIVESDEISESEVEFEAQTRTSFLD